MGLMLSKCGIAKDRLVMHCCARGLDDLEVGLGHGFGQGPRLLRCHCRFCSFGCFLLVDGVLHLLECLRVVNNRNININRCGF